MKTILKETIEADKDELREVMDCEREAWIDVVGKIGEEPIEVYNGLPVYKLVDEKDKLVWIDVEEEEYGFITHNIVRPKSDDFNKFTARRGDEI